MDPSRSRKALDQAQIVVDALIGYSLRGAPRGRTAELIDLCNEHAGHVLCCGMCPERCTWPTSASRRRCTSGSG